MAEGIGLLNQYDKKLISVLNRPGFLHGFSRHMLLIMRMKFVRFYLLLFTILL